MLTQNSKRWTALLGAAGVAVGIYVGLVGVFLNMRSGWWAVAVAPLAAVILGLFYVHPPSGKPMRARSVRLILIVLAAVEVVSFAVPIWWPAITLDGTDPERTNCAVVGETIGRAKWPINNTETGEQIATALLRYSTKCDTTWVKVEDVTTGRRITTQVRRPAGDLLFAAAPKAESDEWDSDAAYSLQIRSVGCVYVEVTVLDGEKVIGRLSEENGCDG